MGVDSSKQFQLVCSTGKIALTFETVLGELSIRRVQMSLFSDGFLLREGEYRPLLDTKSITMFLSFFLTGCNRRLCPQRRASACAFVSEACLC